MAEKEVGLGTVEFQALNTPTKRSGELLIPSPRWRYKGPATTIELSYEVGRHSWAGFAGDSPVIKETLNQPASENWQEFTPERILRGVPLTGLKPADDDIYDMQMWFRSPGFSDQRAIIKGAVKVPSVSAELEIVSCSFS